MISDRTLKTLGALAFLRRHQRGRYILSKVPSHCYPERLQLQAGRIEVFFRSHEIPDFTREVHMSWKENTTHPQLG